MHEKTLNFVFDNWDKGEDKPNNNGFNLFGRDFSHRSLDGIMNYYKYQNYKKFKLNEIKKYPKEKFYYLTNCITPFENFFSKNMLPVSNRVIHYMKNNNNLYLILFNDQESEGIDALKKLDLVCDNLKINKNKVWFINNNSKLLDYKNKINTNLNVHTLKKFSTVLNKNFRNNNIKIDLISKKTDSHLFLCHNNILKEHRLLLLILLKKYDILNDVDWSLINTPKKIFFKHFDVDYNLINDEIESFIAIEPKNSKYENNSKYINRINIERSKFIINKTYENTYFNIITETHFIEHDVHITEKSFKPFYFYQFPIFVASHHHIKYFRKDYDFDLFDDVIDHSYDNIINNKDRLFKIVEEIKRIQENKDFFIKFYEENQDRFINNYEKYLKLNNDYDRDFFTFLI